jgi:hypothetical protein
MCVKFFFTHIKIEVFLHPYQDPSFAKKGGGAGISSFLLQWAICLEMRIRVQDKEVNSL